MSLFNFAKIILLRISDRLSSVVCFFVWVPPPRIVHPPPSHRNLPYGTSLNVALTYLSVTSLHPEAYVSDCSVFVACLV